MELGFWGVYGAVLLAQITSFIIFEIVNYSATLLLTRKRQQRMQEYVEALQSQGIDPYNLQAGGQFLGGAPSRGLRDQTFPTASGEKPQDRGHGHYL
ncbi:MAG: hypothetical protein GF334_04930 [Candidatus Altiarchaeales archaeon]|nr:hypothetical protein [Candidatus Altiarchaeales archaeon]